MGGGGGGKKSSSPAPQLQTFDPAALAQAQAQASATQMRLLPETAEKLAGVNREQGVLDLRQYVQLLQDPGAVIYADDIKKEREAIDALEAELAKGGSQVRNPDWKPSGLAIFGQGGKGSKTSQYISREAAQRRIEQSRKKIAQKRAFDPQTTYDKAFPEIAAEQQRMIRELQGTLGPSDEYRRLQSALNQQYTGQRMDRGGIAAQQVGAGTLGRSLMGRAEQMAQSDGRLNAQAERDAVQAARQGMAARGMATGNAAIGAELLNRDRFARTRQFEDLTFAQGVQAQDLERRFLNASNRQSTDMYNQEAARAALTYNNALGMNLQQANLANRFQQANLAQSEQMRQLATREAIIGQRYASDPMLMLLGAPQPNSQIAGLAAQTTGNAMNMGAQAYSFALNQNNSLYNSYQNNQAAMQAARMQAGATSQAGTMGMIGAGAGMAIGIGAIAI